MVKKSIIGIIVLLVFFVTGLGIYVIGSPDVVIVNHSSQNVNEVIVKLPSNRIVFGAISPKSKNTILYLLKGIETGDTAAVAVVNEDKYIQHNPQTHEGSEGLAALFKRLSKTSPRGEWKNDNGKF